jgi:Dolichyl-phosphate-mannose-protein mannosyltransferase
VTPRSVDEWIVWDTLVIPLDLLDLRRSARLGIRLRRRLEGCRLFLKPSAATIGVLLLAGFGVVVTLQGWRSRIPRFDIVIGIESAQSLIDHGHIPDKGILTSFVSFTAPGVTWLLLPGVLVFHDPRLFEYIGSLGLYVGTVFGIFLLTRRYFGSGTALLAGALYSCSELGLTAGSTLFLTYTTRGFYVWMIYCVGRWVDDDNPNLLAAALLIWATGMYVFMEMAPAILVVPVIWSLYKPSVRVTPLAAVAVLSVALWYPYLRFEAHRDFVDVRSQVFRQSLQPIDFSKAWCDASLVPADWRSDIAQTNALNVSQAEESSLEAIRRWASERANIFYDNVLTSFRTSTVPGGAIVLFGLTLVGLCACFLAGTKEIDARHVTIAWRHRITWLAYGAGFLGILFNEFVLARFIAADAHLETSSILRIRFVEASLVVAAIVCRTYRDTIATGTAAVQRALSTSSTNAKVLGISIAIPWLVLFLIADVERRFWWMWPLQLVLVAVSVVYLPMRLWRLSRGVWIPALFAMLMVANNTVFTSRVHDWIHSGWSGKDANAIQAVDTAATLVRTSGNRGHASIGYEMDVRRFVAIDHIVDSRYKVGADFDMLLWYRHGISNLNRCAEGVLGTDTYRIVQIATDNVGRTDRIEIRDNARFEIVRHAGVYQLRRRR